MLCSRINHSTGDSDVTTNLGLDSCGMTMWWCSRCESSGTGRQNFRPHSLQDVDGLDAVRLGKFVVDELSTRGTFRLMAHAGFG